METTTNRPKMELPEDHKRALHIELPDVPDVAYCGVKRRTPKRYHSWQLAPRDVCVVCREMAMAAGDWDW